MEYDIFRERLGIRFPSFGHALWDPSPKHPNRPVEVGDVGFIRRGKFHRLFNALLPENDKSQDRGVPEYYERLVPKLEDHISESSLSQSDYCSADVCVEVESEYHKPPPDAFQKVSFTYSGKRGGAVLSLPVKARRADTLAQSDFGGWIVKHIDRCFSFVKGLGLGIEHMEDIILVTGCDCARSWTNVAFLEDQVVGRASFGRKVVLAGDSSILIQVEPEHVGQAVWNQGPEGKNLPENQCIFLRGFRVTRSFKLFPKRLKAAAGTSPGPGGYDCEPDAEVIPIPATPEYQDPLHVLLDYIAEREPDCDMALIHDDDLERIEGISDDTTLESLQPGVLMDLLRNSNIEISKACCDLSPAGSFDTDIVWIAMFSTLSKTWNRVLQSQSSFSSADHSDPGPHHASESPSPNLSDCSPLPPLPGDINIFDSDSRGRVGSAADFSPPILDKIRRSYSGVWSSLSKFVVEERHKLSLAVVFIYCMTALLGWMSSFTWLDTAKHLFTLLLANVVLWLWFEREHTHRRLDEMHERMEALQRHMSNTGVPALVAGAQINRPIMAKTTPASWEAMGESMVAGIRPASAEPSGHSESQHFQPDGTIVDDLCRYVHDVISIYTSEDDTDNKEAQRKHMHRCIEIVASLVCCTGIPVDQFGKVGEVLNDLDPTEGTSKMSASSSNPSFTVRWTCLSLAVIRNMVVESNGVRELAGFVMGGIARSQLAYCDQDLAAFMGSRRIDEYLEAAWTHVEHLARTFEPQDQNRTADGVRNILEGCELQISELERIANGASAMEDVDWRIFLFLEIMDGVTNELMQRLPGVSFDELELLRPIPIAEAFYFTIFGSSSITSQFIFPGQQVQALCTLGRELRDIIDGQNHEKHEETIKNLESINKFPIPSRRPKDLMVRQLWRMQDLRDGGGLGFTIELFFFAVRQLSSTSSSPELKEVFYTGTFKVITSGCGATDSIGTLGILLNLICDIVIENRGLFSDFPYPEYVVDMLFDLVRKMAANFGSEHWQIHDAVDELRNSMIVHRNLWDKALLALDPIPLPIPEASSSSS